MKLSECTPGRIVVVTDEYIELYPDRYHRIGTISNLSSLIAPVIKGHLKTWDQHIDSCSIENAVPQVNWSSGASTIIEPKYLKIFED